MNKETALYGVSVVLIGLAVFLVFQYVLPAYYPVWYWAVPVFFFILSFLFSLLVKSEVNKRMSLSKYFILKIGKAFGALLLVVLYTVFAKINVLSFALLVAGFYIVSTLFETKILLQFNRKQSE